MCSPSVARPLVAAACIQPTAATRDLAAARARWGAKGPSAYEATVAIGCFCNLELNRPIIIQVRDGQVTSRRYADTGAPAPATSATSRPTVDDLFGIMADAAARKADRILAIYDASLGYPTAVYIDWRTNTADDEVSYSVTNLKAL